MPRDAPLWREFRTLADEARDRPIYPKQTEPHVHFHEHDGSRHAHSHVHPDDHAHSSQMSLRPNTDRGDL